MKPRLEHRPLCTIELIAEGHRSRSGAGEAAASALWPAPSSLRRLNRCPGEDCSFWDRGCALARIEAELDGRPEVAQLLLDLRRELDSGRVVEIAEARSRFAHLLNEEEGI